MTMAFQAIDPGSTPGRRIFRTEPASSREAASDVE